MHTRAKRSTEMMKQKYIPPEICIVLFSQEDIITASGNPGIELPDDVWTDI